MTCEPCPHHHDIGSGALSYPANIALAAPCSVRMDTLSLFGQPIMTLVADPTGASIYYPQEGKFFHGPATATTFARVIGLPIDLEDVAPLLVGSLQLPPAHKAATIHVQPDAGMPLLRFLDMRGQLIQDGWVDPDQLLPQRAIRYNTHGLPAVDIAYSDFRPIGDHCFPLRANDLGAAYRDRSALAVSHGRPQSRPSANDLPTFPSGRSASFPVRIIWRSLPMDFYVVVSPRRRR